MSIAMPSFFALPSVVGLTPSKVVATDGNNALVSIALPTVSGSALISSDVGVLSWGKPWEGMSYLTGIVCDSPLSGAGTSASHLTVDLSGRQAAHANLTSLAGLSFASVAFVKMTAAGTFGLDTTAYVSGTPWADMGYLTNLSGAVLTSQATPQTIGAPGARLAMLWATDITLTNALAGSVTGNAGSVTNGAYVNVANTFTAVQSIVHANSGALTDLLINPTLKASGKLFDLRVNGASKASIDYAGNIRSSGSISTAIVSKTSDYTITENDSIVLVNSTSSNVIVTLPTAVGCSGREYTVKKTDGSANTVTVTPIVGQLIDGYASEQINYQNTSLSLVSDGANWVVT